MEPFAYSPPRSGILVFSHDGEAWAADGFRIVRLSVPAAAEALGGGTWSTWNVDRADHLRMLVQAGMNARRTRRVPGFLFPKGERRGGWPAADQAERTRKLTELPGASVQVIDLSHMGVERGTIARVRFAGRVVAFVMAQRRRKQE